MESRLRIFLLMISGLLLICVVWDSIIILLISQIFYGNKITIKIQLFMSLRKEHRKKLQPIISLIKSCLSQESNQINNQMQINEGIIEQLLQIDLIKQTNSIPALKLLIYQLLFVLSQQQVATKAEEKSENMEKMSKMGQILFSIKQILKEFNLDIEDSTLKNMEKRNGRDLPPTERFIRNKHRIFVAYYNQFCGTLESFQSKSKTISKKTINKQQSDDLLIGQLESLILKKQQIILELEREKQSYRQKIAELQYQYLEIKSENKELFQHRLFLEEERDQLQSQLLEIMKKTPRQEFIDELFNQKENTHQQQKQKSSYSVYSQIQDTRFNNPPDRDMYYCLLSQSLTIQAMVQ